MAQVAGNPDGHEPLVGRARFFVDAVLGSYSQILFLHSRPAGILLLAASMVAPVQGLMGLGAVLLALGVARIFHFSPDSIRAGLFGYNAMLVGLGIGYLYQPSLAILAVAVVAVIMAVLATATLNAALGASFNLPSLTLPFIFVFLLTLSFTGHLEGVATVQVAYHPLQLGEELPHFLASALKSLGMIFFLPRVDAGLIVLMALLLFSRIGTLLYALGFAAAYLISLHGVAVPDATLHLTMGFNMGLTAVALGGVWFVPGVWSFGFALTGSLLAGMISLGAYYFLQRLGLPLLILPFNLTVLPVLYAMRLRVQAGALRPVDFAMGTPEQNLNYFQTRLARFGYLYYVRFSLPFLGRWVCTQGVDGEHTHRGHWRHGFDFEVRGGDGRTHRSGGRLPEDYLCYRLPVLAPADGTVVKVVDGVPDNKVGELNTRDNWGNLVLTWHGTGLYSLVCHLAPGSVRVKEGEVVRRGAPLGLCGNSGRSPVPHVHFQLQGTERIGAPTIPAAFHEICQAEESGEMLHATAVPEKDWEVRNLERQDELARIFAFPIGADFGLAEGDLPMEPVTSEIDLYGNLMLRSAEKGGILFFESKHSVFTIYDFLGPTSSALSLLQLAVPRVPLGTGRNLTWSDHLVSRHFFAWGLRVLRDFVSPFLGLGGVAMAYRMERQGNRVTVFGESQQKGHAGRPTLTTMATAVDGVGIESVEVVLKGRRRVVRRVDMDAPGDSLADAQ